MANGVRNGQKERLAAGGGLTDEEIEETGGERRAAGDAVDNDCALVDQPTAQTRQEGVRTRTASNAEHCERVELPRRSAWCAWPGGPKGHRGRRLLALLWTESRCHEIIGVILGLLENPDEFRELGANQS